MHCNNVLKVDRLASYSQMTLAWRSCAKTSDGAGEMGIRRRSWMIWLSMQELGFPIQALLLDRDIGLDKQCTVARQPNIAQCRLNIIG